MLLECLEMVIPQSAIESLKKAHESDLIQNSHFRKTIVRYHVPEKETLVHHLHLVGYKTGFPFLCMDPPLNHAKLTLKSMQTN